MLQIKFKDLKYIREQSFIESKVKQLVLFVGLYQVYR